MLPRRGPLYPQLESKCDMLSAETLVMRNCLLIFILPKPRQEAEVIFKNYELLFYGDIYTTLHFTFFKHGLKYRRPILGCEFNSYTCFLLLAVYFYTTQCIKYASKIIRSIVRIYIHSSFWILNFVLSACRPILLSRPALEGPRRECWLKL